MLNLRRQISRLSEACAAGAFPPAARSSATAIVEYNGGQNPKIMYTINYQPTPCVAVTPKVQHPTSEPDVTNISIVDATDSVMSCGSSFIARAGEAQCNSPSCSSSDEQIDYSTIFPGSARRGFLPPCRQGFARNTLALNDGILQGFLNDPLGDFYLKLEELFYNHKSSDSASAWSYLQANILRSYFSGHLVRSKCKCKASSPNGVWKHHHTPLALEEALAPLSQQYILDIVNSLVSLDPIKIKDLADIIASHAIINPLCLQSTKDTLAFDSIAYGAFVSNGTESSWSIVREMCLLPRFRSKWEKHLLNFSVYYEDLEDLSFNLLEGRRPPISVDPCMDAFRAAAGLFGSVSSSTDTLKETAGEVTEFMQHVKDKGVTVNMPDASNLANSINTNVRVDTQHVQNLSDTLGKGVDLNVNFSFLDTVKEWVLGHCAPLKSVIASLEGMSDTKKDALCLILCVSLEIIRLKTESKSRWFNLLGAAAVGIAFLYGSKVVKGFVTGYYGVTIATHLYNYYKSSRFSFTRDTVESYDDEDEVECIPFSDSLTTKSLVQNFSETFLSIVTGILEKAKLREICLALATYKTFVNGLSFTLDSLANLCIDFANLLATPFGAKVFKQAYNKYPQLYVLLDYTFEIKDKLDKAEPFTPMDKDKFTQMKALVRSLKLSIPMNQTVYTNALKDIEKKILDLETVLKTRGVLGTKRRFRPYTYMIVGPSGVAKTRVAPMLADNLLYRKYGPEVLKVLKDSPDAYWYSMKPGKKFHDGFQTTCKVMGMDDHGQLRKAVDPENCTYVQDIYIENNEPYAFQAANVNLKDTLFVKPEITYRTSNTAVFNVDNTHIIEPEAWLSRVECNNGGVIMVKPKPQYRKESSGSWSFTANDLLRSKQKYDTTACDYYLYDLRGGIKPPEDKSKKDKKVLPLGKQVGDAMDWNQLNYFLYDRFEEWETNEKMKYLYDTESYLDPVINPLIIGPRAKPVLAEAMADYPSDPRLSKSLAEEGIDLNSLTREQAIALLKAKDAPVRTLSRPVLSDFDNYKDFSKALKEYYQESVNVFYARGGSPLWFSRVSALCWGAIMGDDWAGIAIKHREAINRVLYDHVCSNPHISMVLSKEAMSGCIQHCDLDITKWYEVITAGVIDIYTKIKYMAEMTSKSINDTVDRCEGLGWKAVISNSVEDVLRLFSDLWLTYLDTLWTVQSILSFDNFWVSWLSSTLAGALLAAKAVEVTACGEAYERMGKVVKKPLNTSCKITKMPVKACHCNKCVDYKSCLKNYNPGKADLGNCVCKTCVVPAKPLFESFNKNAEEALRGLTKRNVWSIQFLPSKHSKPLAVQNITMICTELGVTNAHFIVECTKLAQAHPEGFLRLVNWNTTRHFDVIFDLDQWDLNIINDKAYWLNKSYCSFGGGIRTIVNSFVSRHDPPVHAGRAVKMKYNREESMVEYELVKVKIGDDHVISYDSGDLHYQYKAINIEFQATPGNCGAPVMTADTAVKKPGFLGIIVGGAKGDAGTLNSYVTGITREEIVYMLEKHEINPFNTDNLPSEVETVSVVPAGFVVAAIEPDDHSVMMFNPIKPTHFKDCAGKVDLSPTFVSAWEREADGTVVYPMDINRAKSVTNGPAVNPYIYQQAVVMAADSFEKHLPEGRRAFRQSTSEALEGANDEARFSARTSPGGKYILKGWAKKDIVKLKDDGRGSTVFDFSSPEGQEFLRDIEIATQERENRVISLSYANEFPKAELIPTEKVYAGKVRAVRGDDQDQVIADKKELACLSYLLKKASIASGLVVGKDPFSQDFNLMAKLLQIYSNIDAGDHSGWDTNFFRYKYQGVFSFIKLILHDATPEHLRAIESCVHNMLYKIHLAHIRVTPGEDGPIFMAKRVIFEIMHGMISGSYNTLNFNTIGHYIDIRYITLCLYSEKILGVPYLQYRPAKHGMIPFRDINRNMLTFITGDDILSSCSPGLAWVNFYNMKEMYGNHNMVLTTDKKDGVSTTHEIVRYSQNPADFTFCKRTPRYCAEYNMYVWCLAIMSLLKSIYFSEDFSDHEQVIDNFFRELSVWGNAVFQQYAPPVARISRSKYGYHSPFCVYEIALMFALGGLNKKRAARIYLAVEIGDLDHDLLSTFDLELIQESCESSGMSLAEY